MDISHKYIKVNLGHSDLACEYCGGTPMENIAIGEDNNCTEAKRLIKESLDELRENSDGK